MGSAGQSTDSRCFDMIPTPVRHFQRTRLPIFSIGIRHRQGALTEIDRRPPQAHQFRFPKARIQSENDNALQLVCAAISSRSLFRRREDRWSWAAHAASSNPFQWIGGQLPPTDCCAQGWVSKPTSRFRLARASSVDRCPSCQYPSTLASVMRSSDNFPVLGAELSRILMPFQRPRRRIARIPRKILGHELSQRRDSSELTIVSPPPARISALSDSCLPSPWSYCNVRNSLGNGASHTSKS